MKNYSGKCPNCGEEKLFRTEPVWEGFKKIGEKIFCISCGSEIHQAQIKNKEEANPDKPEEKSNSLSGRAGTLFSSDMLELNLESQRINIFSDDKKDMHFCRDCKYFIKHPFMSRCSLHNKEVEPMDDCPDFELPQHKDSTQTTKESTG